MKPSVSIIVPVYNEKESVEKTLRDLVSVCASCTAEFEIIAINDNSSDGSGDVLAAFNTSEITVINHPVNRGYGASLKSGIRVARFPWILIVDADGTYPINKIPELISLSDECDMVVGSRNGDKVHDTFLRSIGRGMVRKFASYISGHKIQDINSGLRIFKKEDALRFWHLFPEGFSFTSTITVAEHSHSLSVKYLPIDYHKRVGKSSIRPIKDFFGFMSLIAKLAIYFKPLKVFIPAGIFLIVLAMALVVGGYFWFGQIFDATFAVIFITGIQVFIFGFIADMIVKRFYS